jgi:hypothetical protein
MPPGRTVATLAARARIRELEESHEWISSRGSQQRERKTPGVSQEIVALSLRYGLLSRETSYVAIERRSSPVPGDVQLRRVPIALTADWGGLRRGLSHVLALPATSPRRITAVGNVVDPTMFFGSARPGASAKRRGSDPLVSALASGDLSELLHKRKVTAAAGAFVALVSLQHADGSWELDERFATVLGHDLRELESALGASAPVGTARRAWATALALALLRRCAADLEDEWRLLARKAEAWLSANAAPAPKGLSWMQAAEDFLAAGTHWA